MAEERQRPKFEVSPDGWRVIGWTGAVVGVVCLIGLAAVLALKGEDALATVALVLAITAFVVQIIVAIMSSAAARGAEAAAQSLNFETNKALEQIKASAAANQAILARQFDTLLDALIKRSPGAKSEADEGISTASDIWSLRGGFRPGPSAEAQRIIDRLRTFPSEDEAGPVVEAFQRLSPAGVAMLDRYARDELNSRETGAEPGLRSVKDSPAHTQARDQLMGEGLLEDRGDGYHALSDQGREVARLLKGRGLPGPTVAKTLGLG